MQYMLLIYEDERIFGEEEDNPALQEIVAKHGQFAQSLGEALKGGAGLKSTATATTVRTASGSQAIHDGPFAETKEQLGGYYVVDVPDLDAAIALAKRIPMMGNGAVEIRPLIEDDDPGAA
jgi:hypothetical protein